MYKNRVLLPAALILIITGCSTTPYQSGQEASSASRNSGPGAAVARGLPTRKPRSTTPHHEQAIASVPGSSDAVAETTEINDVWQRIAAGLTLDRSVADRCVKEKLAWYSRNQEYLDRVAERARPYLYYIVTELERRRMPLDLALLPIVESAYHPFAHSSSAASGIWQFIPSTGLHYGLKQNWWYDGRRDIVAATQAALDYLQKLNQEFNGDWLLSLAAYNMGELNVARSIERNRKEGKKLDFWSLPMPRETRDYVPSLLAVAELVARPEQYGIAWKPIPNTAYFAQVETGGQLDLALVADLSGQNMDEVYILNPAYNRFATDPDGPHSVLIPVDKAALFKSRLSDLPQNQRVTWTRHVIQRGESVGSIAQQYHIGADALKRANGLHGNLVHAGNSLLIPTSREPDLHYTLSADARLYQGLQKSGAGEKYIYTVQQGDNLWDISQHYGISVDRLCDWNSIQAENVLSPGRKLTVWLTQDVKTPAAKNSTQETNPARSTAEIETDSVNSYTVKAGDTLWLIAKRFGTSVTELMDRNHLIKGSSLKPGQQISIKTADYRQANMESSSPQVANNSTQNYTVKKGDTLWLISKRFGTTINQLLQWNNLPASHRLQPGQTLVVYPSEA